MPDPAIEIESVVLGWRVTPADEPRYWLRPGAKAGGQPPGELVRISADLMATHTAILAQSGSGKSVFLGRLMEEILVATKARCVIFDPNADFRKAYEPQDDSFWAQAGYSPVTREGRLPHEASRNEFDDRWAPISKVILVGPYGGPWPPPYYASVRVGWPDVSADLIGEGFPPATRSELYHLHRIVRALTPLNIDVTSIAERLAFLALQRAGTASDLGATLPGVFKEFFGSPEGGEHIARVRIAASAVEDMHATVQDAARYVSTTTVRFYFARARQLRESGVVTGQACDLMSGDARLAVVDLPSIPERDIRLLVVDTLLAAQWDRARAEWGRALERYPSPDARVPTFIVVDEAHNLIPASAQDPLELSIRDRFRRIVAEGRKYGLFLVILSQRPDKLDELVLSACENKAVMRLDSEAVLDVVKRALGLDQVPPALLRRCLTFHKSRVLIAGVWAGRSPKILYAAARRTREGGTNLRPEHWAVPVR